MISQATRSLRRSLKRSLTLALACLSLTASSACGGQSEDAEQAARAFISAVRSRDAGKVVARLDAPTRAKIDQMAELATDRVGGRRTVLAEEIVQVVSVDPDFDVAAVEVFELDADHVRVELTAPDGATEQVEMVREPEGWRVRLVLPANLAPVPAPTPES